LRLSRVSPNRLGFAGVNFTRAKVHGFLRISNEI
jgi:hypothetical protein